eukprot:TRINITY_DN201_c0_g1::TRINITY_DN201_c0_g1_i1::g.1721::m.1721 TRINITY_DN201_c0_g1::TRINITY_DN201_c0_g1_i1::g.1721  ORF type:complete len:144 (+),score=17.96,sp/P0CW97/PCR3_ARATH/37.90/3e-15,PLAC8/PF04749.12/3.3e-23 TRINITY_DN201_c0_g1_i1:112-543(+)
MAQVMYPQQPAVVVVNNAPQGPGVWKTSAIDCCAPPGGLGTCILTWCAPCVTYGQTYEKVGQGSCLVGCCLYIICAQCYLCCVMGCQTRGIIRQKYNIPGSTIEDCFCHMCCPLCALTQESNTVMAYEMARSQAPATQVIIAR